MRAVGEAVSEAVRGAVFVATCAALWASGCTIDQGIDVGVADDDAFVEGLDAPGLDAPGLDAARPPPASFNGSGCRCSLAQRGASSRSLAFLVCLGAILRLARGALGRRRQR